jgi:hypothetical protein
MLPRSGPFPADPLPTVRRTLALPARDAAPAFEQALIRQGRVEHEWLQFGHEGLADFERGTARMVVAPGRCLAATDDEPVEIDIVIARGTSPAVLDLLYRLPEGSWLMVNDAWDTPILDGLVEDTESRVRIELPDGRVRISARLAASGRLSVRTAKTDR